MSAPTPRELEVMRHALGADSRTPGYRNYYCTGVGDALLQAMAAKGLMKAGRTINEGRDRYYSVPEEWRKTLGVPACE